MTRPEVREAPQLSLPVSTEFWLPTRTIRSPINPVENPNGELSWGQEKVLMVSDLGSISVQLLEKNHYLSRSLYPQIKLDTNQNLEHPLSIFLYHPGVSLQEMLNLWSWPITAKSGHVGDPKDAIAVFKTISPSQSNETIPFRHAMGYDLKKHRFTDIDFWRHSERGLIPATIDRVDSQAFFPNMQTFIKGLKIYVANEETPEKACEELARAIENNPNLETDKEHPSFITLSYY